MLLFASLYFSDPSGSNLFFFSSLPLSHRSRISSEAYVFLLLLFFCFFVFPTTFAKDFTSCFSDCCVESNDHWIHVCTFIVHDGERYKLPAYHSLETFNTLGSFSFSWSNFSLMCLGWLILFRRRWKVVISNSWPLPMSAPGKRRVLAMFTHSWSEALRH